MDWKRQFRRFHVGGIVIALIVLIVVIAIYTIDMSPDLEHVDVKMLSGGPEGNYHAIVERVRKTGASDGADIENAESAGSVDNLRQLAEGCNAQFAVVQDGVPSQGGSIELIGRLQRTEAMLIIGRDASTLTRFDQLASKRIGIGPKDSGTAYLARAILGIDEFKSLGFELVSMDNMQKQLDALISGRLDLGVFVLDDRADLAKKAIRDHGLQLARFEHLQVLANRFSSVSLGVIPAGQYSPISPILPASDVPVLRVHTLIVGNGCASHSETVGLLTVISKALPGFINANESVEGGAFPQNTTARDFFHEGGAGWADEHVPWLVDIMPLGNWIYVAMAISLLFNGLSAWHRVRLWRIDANRDKAHQIVRDALGEELTPAEILELDPEDKHRELGVAASIDMAIEQLDKLRVKTRKQENSWLVPLAKEWIYRYEEEQMEILLTALRVFRNKLATSAAA